MKTIFTFIFLILGAAVLLTYWSQGSANQKLFLKGKFPSPLPDGTYKGNASYTGAWLGKKFNAETKTGINIFESNGTTSEKYPFLTYEGKGIRDEELSVLKIDYDLPENPWWLRFVLDEIVETESGKYLGKLHVRIINGFPFTLGYFTQEK